MIKDCKKYANLKFAWFDESKKLSFFDANNKIAAVVVVWWKINKLFVWLTWLVFFQSMVLMAGPGYISMMLWWWYPDITPPPPTPSWNFMAAPTAPAAGWGGYVAHPAILTEDGHPGEGDTLQRQDSPQSQSLTPHWWQNVYPEVSIFPDILSLWKFQCFFPDQILTTTMAGTCQDQLDTWSATVKYFWQSSASSVSGVQVTAGTDLWSPAGLVWVKSSAILLPAHSPPPATQPSIPRSTMFPRPDTRTLWPELSWAHSEPGPTSWHSSPVSHPIGSAWGANVCILTTIQCVLSSHHLPANHSSFSSPTLSILWFPFYFKIWNIFPTIVWQAHASKHLLVVVEACWIICERLPSLTAVSVSTISACITSSVPASLLELCHKIIKNFV